MRLSQNIKSLPQFHEWNWAPYYCTQSPLCLPPSLLTPASTRALGTLDILVSAISTIPKHTLFCAFPPITLCQDYLCSAHQSLRWSNQNSSTAPLVLEFESSIVFFWHSYETYLCMCLSPLFRRGQESVLLVFASPRCPTSRMLQTRKRQKMEGEKEVWREGRNNNIIEFITCYS